MSILITGGAGYIGSHTILNALQQNQEIVVVDSLERGYKNSLDRIKEITNQAVLFHQADLRDYDSLHSIINEYKLEAAIHFAAYKSVAESEQIPQKYYENNVGGTENLLKCLVTHNVERIIFSSTAAVYDPSQNLPFDENTPTGPINAYEKSKLQAESIIIKYAQTYGLQALAFRYFNVVGAEESGRMGEDPRSCTNLVPLVMQTLLGKREEVLLFGNNFNTEDGSQERDYINVQDLADAHIKALTTQLTPGNMEIINLSTGTPTSCLKIFQLAQEISGRKLTYRVVEPRAGDPEKVYSRNEKAKQRLSWSPQKDINASIESQWKWTINNRDGYSY